MKYLNIITVVVAVIFSTAVNADNILTSDEKSHCLIKSEQLEHRYDKFEELIKALDKVDSKITNLESNLKSTESRIKTAKSDLQSCNLMRNQSCQYESQEVSQL